MKLKITHLYFPMIVLIATAFILIARGSAVTMDSMARMQETTDEYISGQAAISGMRETSDYLTNESRAFVVTGKEYHARNYFDEINVNKRREAALEAVREYSESEETYAQLAGALEESDALAQMEIYAMRLAAEGYGLEPGAISMQLAEVELTEEDAALVAGAKRIKSREMLFSSEYTVQKENIIRNVTGSMESLLKETGDRQVESYEMARTYSRREHLMTMAVLVIVALLLAVTALMVIVPIKRSTGYISAHEPLPVRGAAEYAYLAESYNSMLEKTRRSHEKLSYEATHDPLTGLFNRKTFETSREELKDSNIALLLVDVDNFKDVNDLNGHDVGDSVLIKVAEALRSSFRSEDRICRIGGDEFAVIMLQMVPELKPVVLNKIGQVREKIAAKDDLPEVTVSIGAAFSEEDGAGLFKRADLALYDAKERGRNGYSFYEPGMLAGQAEKEDNTYRMEEEKDADH